MEGEYHAAWVEPRRLVYLDELIRQGPERWRLDRIRRHEHDQWSGLLQGFSICIGGQGRHGRRSLNSSSVETYQVRRFPT